MLTTTPFLAFIAGSVTMAIATLFSIRRFFKRNGVVSVAIYNLIKEYSEADASEEELRRGHNTVIILVIAVDLVISVLLATATAYIFL